MVITILVAVLCVCVWVILLKRDGSVPSEKPLSGKNKELSEEHAENKKTAKLPDVNIDDLMTSKSDIESQLMRLTLAPLLPPVEDGAKLFFPPKSKYGNRRAHISPDGKHAVFLFTEPSKRFSIYLSGYPLDSRTYNI